MPVSVRTHGPRRYARLVVGLAVLAAMSAEPAPAPAPPADRPAAVVAVQAAAPASPAPREVPDAEPPARLAAVMVPAATAVMPAGVAVRACHRRAPPG
jgi:hypothetical protein